MQRIDTSTAQKDKFGAGKNGFTDGNPQTGTPATDLDSAFFDSVQEELCNTIETAGFTLDPANNTQLLTAINSIVSTAISKATASIVPDIGQLFFTTDLTNPNTKYPGTTWSYLGEGLTLRTAMADGTDLNAIVGGDRTTVTADNLPAHTHTIGGSTGSSTAASLTTSSFDYGSKSSNSPGDHTHTETRAAPASPASVYLRTDAESAGYSTTNTGAAGNHTHSTAIGAHNHTGDIPAHSHTLPAATGSVGSGTEISILQKSINVAIWVRTA
ncbi:TPA: hypothetical protein ACNIQM_000768 [Citrobacter werkmanii]